MDARQRNLLNNDRVQGQVKRFKKDKLTSALFQQYLQGKLSVTEEQIKQVMKKKPKWDRKRAEASIKTNKAKKLIAEYYDQLYKKANVKVL